MAHNALPVFPRGRFCAFTILLVYSNNTLTILLPYSNNTLTQPFQYYNMADMVKVFTIYPFGVTH